MVTHKSVDTATVSTCRVTPSTLEEAIKTPAMTAILTKSESKKLLTETPLSQLRDQRAKHTKLAQRHIAESLARSSKHTQVTTALDLTSCGRYAVVKGEFVRPLNRCHRRSCPLCTHIKGRQLTARIMRAIENMRFTLEDVESDTDRRMRAVKVTLNGGRACHFEHMRTRLSSLHKIWSRFLKTNGIKQHLIGALRSTEITETEDDPHHANPHIHGLLLVRTSIDHETIHRLLLDYWPRAIKREITRTERAAKHDVSHSVKAVEYTLTQTPFDVKGWVTYITKGSYDLGNAKHREKHAITTYNYWISVDDAIKGMRMISASGDLKEAIAIAKEHEAHEKARRAEELHPTDATPSHVWSDYRQRYIEVDQANEHDVSFTTLVRSMSYIEPPPLFGLIARNEIRNHLNAAELRRYQEIRSRLINSENRDVLSMIDDLITYKHKKVTDDDSSDDVSFYEPQEIERSSLAKRLRDRQHPAEAPTQQSTIGGES